MSGTAIIRAYYRLRLYNIILYIWDVFFRESNEPCKIVAWKAGCSQTSLTGNDFIGRMPASEMERSGIELAARRSTGAHKAGCLQHGEVSKRRISTITSGSSFETTNHRAWPAKEKENNIMKRKVLAITAASVMASIMLAGTAMAAEYKVGIIQFVDDASLNQIEAAIEAQLDVLSEEGEDKYIYDGYVFNGQADATTLGQIAAQLISDEVDVIVPIATPAAQIVQAATEDTDIPVVFSAVSDPSEYYRNVRCA